MILADSFEAIDSVTPIVGDSLLDELLITIIASVLTWTFLKFMEKVAYPWYEQISYRGLKISGKWQATVLLDDKTKYHEDFEIDQRGHELSGTYTVKNEYAGGHKFSSYNLNGKIINNHVTFTCYIKSQKEIGISTFILEIVDGGESLEGKSLWINRGGKDIARLDNYKMTRV